MAIGAIVLVTHLVCAGSYLILRRPPPSALDRFWAPVLDSPKPVLLYCGQPVVYFLSRSVHEQYRKKVPAETRRGAYTVVLDPTETIKGSDIVPVTDQFVGIGNAHTSALLRQRIRRPEESPSRSVTRTTFRSAISAVRRRC